MVEEHARRTVHLGDDHALRTVHDKCTVIRHHRHIDEVNILLLDVADRTQTRVHIHIEYRQTQRHAQRRSIGHAALLTFFNIVFRLFEFILHKINLSFIAEILDREHRSQNFLQARHFSLVGGNFFLLEAFIRLALKLNQVWHLGHFLDLAETAANAFTACKAVDAIGWNIILH